MPINQLHDTRKKQIVELCPGRGTPDAPHAARPGRIDPYVQVAEATFDKLRTWRAPQKPQILHAFL